MEGGKNPAKFSRESCLVKSEDADVISSIRTQISGTLIGRIRSKGVGLLQLPFSPTLCHHSILFPPFYRA